MTSATTSGAGSSSPALWVLCGLPGSGKTTAARKLEAAGRGVWLNGDDWLHALFPADAEAAARDERRDRVEALQWQVAEQLLSAGVSVILDWGVWTRAERDDLRAKAAALGAEFHLVYTEAPLDVLHARLAERNNSLPPGTFHVSVDELDEWAELFEVPQPDELD